MDFILTERFKPYTRMTQAGKFASKAAQQYLASKDRLAYQFRQQMDGREMYPLRVPLSLVVRIVSECGFNHCDLSNQLKALEDAANKIVYDDDRWVDEIYIARRRGSIDRVKFSVNPLPLAHCPCCGRPVER